MYSGNRHELGVRSSNFMEIHSYIFEKKHYFPIYTNSFVCIQTKRHELGVRSSHFMGIHSYIFEKKNKTNTFVYIRIHSYIFEKNIPILKISYLFDFIRIYSRKKTDQYFCIYSNSFVYIRKKNRPILSYIFEFVRMYPGNRHELGVRSSNFTGIHSYLIRKKTRLILSYI